MLSFKENIGNVLEVIEIKRRFHDKFNETFRLYDFVSNHNLETASASSMVPCGPLHITALATSEVFRIAGSTPWI